MKRIVFVFIFLISVVSVNATDYYFKNSGNDGAAGTSDATAWEHPNNHSYSSGDHLYLYTGDVFDTTNLASKFYLLDNILIRTYGGSEPATLSGGIRVTDFVSMGNDIWFSLQDLGTFPRGGEIYTPNGITVNGRWKQPANNEEVLETDNSACGLTTVALKTATFVANELIGAWVAMMTRKWKWSTTPIASNTASVITTTTSMITNPYNSSKDTYCKIWNYDPYMDTENEWTYDGDTLKMYSTTNPNTTKNIRLTMVDTIIANIGGDNFRIENVIIEQANHIGFYTTAGTGAYCDTVQIKSISGTAFYNNGTDTVSLYNSKAEDILEYVFKTESADNILVGRNYFNRTGYTCGLSNRDYDVGSSGAIRAEALKDYGTAIYLFNYFDSCGLGFQLYSDHNYTTSIVKYNWIENFGLNRVDNGAVYWASQYWSVGVWRNYKNNFMLNSISFGVGRFGGSSSSENHPVAVYVDEDAILVMADSNSIESVHGLPLKYNRRNRGSFNYNRVVRGNTSQGNTITNVQWMCGQAVGSSEESADGDTMQFNQFVLDGDANTAVYSRNTTTKWDTSGIDNNYFYIDHNKYAFPYGTYNNIARYNIDYGSGWNTYSLAQIQSSGGNFSTNTQDANSSIEMQNDYSGKSYDEETYVRLFKNYSMTSHDFDLDGTYKDIDGNTVTTSITVAPMYSEILFLQSGSEDDETVYFDYDLIHFLDAPVDAPVDASRLNTFKEGTQKKTMRNGTRKYFYRRD